MAEELSQARAYDEVEWPGRVVVEDQGRWIDRKLLSMPTRKERSVGKRRWFGLSQEAHMSFYQWHLIPIGVFLCLALPGGCGQASSAGSRRASSHEGVSKAVFIDHELIKALSKVDLSEAVQQLERHERQPETVHRTGLAFVPQPIVMGGPRFFVAKTPDTSAFWIMVPNGGAGETSWYGPARLTKDGALVPAKRRHNGDGLDANKQKGVGVLPKSLSFRNDVPRCRASDQVGLRLRSLGGAI